MLTIQKGLLKAIHAGLKLVLPRRKSSVPVLEHVLVRGDASGWSFAATDLEQTAMYRVPHDDIQGTYEETSFLVPGDTIKELCKGRKAESVSLAPLDDERITVTTTVKGQEISRTVNSLAPEEWPMERRRQDVTTESMHIGAFVRAYRDAAIASSTDESRYALSGVFVDAPAQCLVGTDGRRLMMRELQELPLEHQVILPVTRFLKGKTLEGHADGSIGLVLDDDNPVSLCLRAGPWQYRVRLIEAQFPDYTAVIPELAGIQSSVQVATDDVATVKAACGQFPGDKSDPVLLYADAQRVALLHQGEHGFSHVVLPGSTAVAEAPAVLAFARGFLLDGLEAGFTELHVQTETKPVRCQSPEHPGCYVVMPMQGRCRLDDVIAYVDQTIEPPSQAQPNPEPRETKMPQDTPQTMKPELVEEQDPMDELLDAIDTAREAVKEANTALRSLKKLARAVERDRKAEQKELSDITNVVGKLSKLAA